MSEQNGWISIDDARFTLSKYVGDEIVIRTCKKNLWPDCANGQAQSARPNLP